MVVDGKNSAAFWSCGYYGMRPLHEKAIEAVRKEAETMDNFQGFQYFHAAGGGTGSGVATRLME